MGDHVDMVKEPDRLTSESLLKFLKNTEFATIYRETICVTPIIYRNQTSPKKERIHICQEQQKKILAILKTEYQGRTVLI